jgi:hypothetical protein
MSQAACACCRILLVLPEPCQVLGGARSCCLVEMVGCHDFSVDEKWTPHGHSMHGMMDHQSACHQRALPSSLPLPDNPVSYQYLAAQLALLRTRQATKCMRGA